MSSLTVMAGFKGQSQSEELCHDRSEAQMNIFGAIMPIHARAKQIAAYSDIFRRVKMAGMRRIIDRIMLIRATLLKLCD